MKMEQKGIGSMPMNAMAKEIHENAKKHGWWETEGLEYVWRRNAGELLMLCVSELAEALEEYRDGKPPLYYVVEMRDENGGKYPAIREDVYNTCANEEWKGEKPEGFAVELADCIIRILDMAEAYGFDMERIISLKHEYNKTRPYRHGGKKA
jgi:NTP pyrophosphatase (non-canonical NTP hydrolase)